MVEEGWPNTNVLGAEEDEDEVASGAVVEPLLAAPNMAGVGVADDEVVALGGLLARKEMAGFGAAVESVQGDTDTVSNNVFWFHKLLSWYHFLKRNNINKPEQTDRNVGVLCNKLDNMAKKRTTMCQSISIVID